MEFNSVLGQYHVRSVKKSLEKGRSAKSRIKTAPRAGGALPSRNAPLFLLFHWPLAFRRFLSPSALPSNPLTHTHTLAERQKSQQVFSFKGRQPRYANNRRIDGAPPRSSATCELALIHRLLKPLVDSGLDLPGLGYFYFPQSCGKERRRRGRRRRWWWR